MAYVTAMTKIQTTLAVALLLGGCGGQKDPPPTSAVGWTCFGINSTDPRFFHDGIYCAAVFDETDKMFYCVPCSAPDMQPYLCLTTLAPNPWNIYPKCIYGPFTRK